ncbi:hypothetical protein BBK36DRAFT_1137419 [Trichoderma citrinoviride]|uniref:Uncharacterized protein n=1 Tax=Trichoderma citrinoviride TaxID=58853 RepID=A0A2T4BN63_9HYPO|nr:hypothetical protein BBK36DRAFT_1137419 [Trichoderma citrinoviride]PTB70764.1 hypothetical protein BBK36DRAFT_1137419 [Trichoderma citrinoviride]
MAPGTRTLKPSAEAPYTGRITRSRAASQKKQEQQQQQPPPKLRRSKRKRAVADDEDDDDGDKDGDGNKDDNNNPKDKSPPPKRKRGANRCKFCGADPVGKQLFQERPCDYTKIWKENFIECRNCADHRSRNPGVQHKCQPPNINKVWRQYGVADPTTYTPATCDQCLGGKLAHQCNVDPILGYGCSTTKACREGTCTVNGQPMEKPPRPQANVVRWTRAECHVCENKTKKGTGTMGCSWLRDRTTWDQACDYCQAHNLVCMSGGNIIASPARLTLPKTWALNHQVFDWGFIECRAINPHRRNCKRCLEDGHEHCRVDAGAYDFACNRCAQLGIDCIDSKDDTHYPLFDLARVGIGGFMPFPECSCCTKHGRNCDLQRPCDSCVKHGDECDEFKGVTARYCFNGRLSPPPGPLYYLALGYGAQGVDDPKDGSAIEHWVGPTTNVYCMLPDKQKKEYLTALGAHLKAKLHPPGVPPHGDATQGGLVAGRASEITQQQIVAWIQAQWPQARPMNQFDVYQGYVDEAQQQVQIVRAGGAGKRIPRLRSGNGEEDSGDNDGHDDSNGDGNDDDNDGDNHGDDNDGNGDDGNGDTPMDDTAGSNDQEHARIRTADTAAALALAHSAIASPLPPAPPPLEVDGDSSHWLLGYISQDNIIADGAGVAAAAAPPIGNPFLHVPAQEQFNFDAALRSMMSDLDFNGFDVPVSDSNIDPNLASVFFTGNVDLSQVEVPVVDPSMDVNIDLGSFAVNPDFNPFQVPGPELGMDVNGINFDDVNIDDIDVNDINLDDIDAISMADIDFNLDGDLYTDFNPIQAPEADDSADTDIDPDLYRGEPNFDPFQVDEDAIIDVDIDPVLDPVAGPEIQVGADHSVHTNTDPNTGLLNTPGLDYAMMTLLMPYMRGDAAPAEDHDPVG